MEYVASGGARLQEGMIALIQMARTASAVAGHGRAGLMSAAVLRAPTTGGVYASWASLSDVRAAEPGAVIGFGGPRVVAEVTGQWPPADSHTAESAYANGVVDALVSEDNQTAWLTAAVGLSPASRCGYRQGGLVPQRRARRIRPTRTRSSWRPGAGTGHQVSSGPPG